METRTVESEQWYKSLEEPVRLLVKQAVRLIKDANHTSPEDEIYDYGYLVFSAAKAYEGFLKNYFYKMGFISKNVVSDDHFRIGKALNPDLPKKYRNKSWLYDNVSDVCGTELAGFLWTAWREGRNQVFHFQNEKDNSLSYEDAVEKVELIFEAIDRAQKCEMGYKRRD